MPMANMSKALSVTDRPLVLTNSQHPSISFSAFLDSAFAAFIALLFAWRLLLFGNKEKDGDEPMAQSSMRSLTALLPTDTLPSSVQDVSSSTPQCYFIPPVTNHQNPQPLATASSQPPVRSSVSAPAYVPVPSLISNRVPVLLTQPAHEMPPCNIDRYLQFSEAYLNPIPEEESDDLCSLSSCSSRRAPTVIPAHPSSPYKEALSPRRTPPSSVTPSALVSSAVLSTPSPPPPVPSQHTQPVPFEQLARTLRSIDSDTDSSMDSMEKVCCTTTRAHHLPFTTYLMNEMAADRDRDQCEILVEGMLGTINPIEERCSLNSVSLSLDQTHDSVLDTSICSNPIDETAIMEKTIIERRVADMDDIERSAKVVESVSATATRHTPPSPRPSPVAQTTAPQSMPSLSFQNTMSVGSTLPSASSMNPAGIRDVDLERSIQRFARYGQIYADSPKSQMQYVDERRMRMSSPLNLPPPPPPIPAVLTPPLTNSSLYSSHKNFRDTVVDQRETDMSRDDYDLRSEARSRSSTMRDIPVQRGPISLNPSSATTVEYRSSSTPYTDNCQQQEYYRKEVMTRTYITRSTEALSAPPLSRSSPIIVEHERYPSSDRYYQPGVREERTVDYNIKYAKNIEEEERRIREDQGKRKAEEEERRRRDEEERRVWEIREKEYYERSRRERDRKHRELESERLERERAELDRLEKERGHREQGELQRRMEWEMMEKERRTLEEKELEKRRALERDRLEKQRLEEERRERERIEKERLERERERIERERLEKERFERERIERERIETERIEIERIERIKREKQERERFEREKEKEEEERREKERLEHERIAREKRELLRIEQEMLEAQRREAEMREAERIEEENREARRREQERRDAEVMAEMKRKAEEREAQRRLAERMEKERIENLRKEQERLELERQDADRRERQRMEEERREKELRDAQRRAAERREQERLDDEKKERERQEAERKEAEMREMERREAMRRERDRRLEEETERENLAELERAAQERRAARVSEMQRDEQRVLLERRTQEMKEAERIETQRREKERLEEEMHLAELREREKRNAELRDRERRDAVERESERRREDRRSRDKLDHLAREIEEKEKMEAEKRRLLSQLDHDNRRREMLTSRETLEKLTKAPYYSRENLAYPLGSRENLGEVTKVERKVIERVDRTYWADEPRHRSTSVSSPTDMTTAKERMYHQRKLADDDDFARGGSRRTSRYRSKMEKARKDFLSADSSPTSDALNDRFKQISEDMQRPRPEYRGPSRQRFNSGEVISSSRVGSQPYPRVGPSPYDQVEETNLDEVHRSGSVMDYARRSRRDGTDGEASHSRSKSADYLMDSKMREESAPPENDLQKFGDKTPNLSEHEMRFHKSTEKLHVPDWYRDKKSANGGDLNTSFDRTPDPVTTSHSTSSSYTNQYSAHYSSRQDPSYLNQGQSSYSTDRYRTTEREPEPVIETPSDSLSLPQGMFDKYRDEIEDLRRSRSSLHPQMIDDRKGDDEITSAARSADSKGPTSMTKSPSPSLTGRQLPGYTVTDVPVNWNIARDRHSRVIEVADTFVSPKGSEGGSGIRYGGRVTIEEVLDSIFQQTKPSLTNGYSDSSLPQRDGDEANIDGPGIYTKNYMLMDQVMRDPSEAEDLLKHERLFVRCAHCHKTNELGAARVLYVSCKNCYTYYCGRQCREWDWDRHKERCSFARINTLCKDVIMTVREDPEAQWFMSKIAREGYAARDRGSVNLRLSSSHLAECYVAEGWAALAHIDLGQLLFYYTVNALVDEHKEPSLIALCRKYDPGDKFILSVSIVADIEQCPQTPPPESVPRQLAEDPSSVNAVAFPRPSSLTDPQHPIVFSPSEEFRSAVPTEV